jgi:hypothetical protein
MPIPSNSNDLVPTTPCDFAVRMFLTLIVHGVHAPTRSCNVEFDSER